MVYEEDIDRTWKELPKKRDKDVITLYASIKRNLQILEVAPNGRS